MSKMGNLHSDTDRDSATVIGKRKPVTTILRKEGDVNAALRSGVQLVTQPKSGVSLNRQHLSSKNTLKLDEETEELHHERVPQTLGKTMQQARDVQGWSQKDLATRISERPQVVTEYESGKAIPNSQILTKMERALGVKLRGKDMGKPLHAKDDKKKPAAKK